MLDSQKYNMKKNHKNYKKLYMKFALKIGSFLARQQQVIKMKIKGVIKSLKIKKIKI